MSNKTKVTVILTSYNHAQYLGESIESVLNQTFRDFKLIICDDASTDNSWEIIQSYKDSRIYAFRNEINKRGIVNSVLSSNKDLSNYIAIHHSDDIWEQDKLAKQVNYLDTHPNIGAVFSRAHIIDEAGEPFKDTSHVYYNIFEQQNRSRFEWLNHFFKQGNALCHPSVLIRRECYEKCGKYRYGLSLLPDLDMWVRLCLNYEIYVMEEKLIRFRVKKGGKSSSTGGVEMRARRPFEYLQVLDNYRSINSPDEFTQIFPEAKKYIKADGFDLKFALGMISLEARPDKFVKLFGLTLLFEALNDSKRASQIRELYNFGHTELISLVTKHDVFSINTSLQPFTSFESENHYEISQRLQILEQELQQIHSSKAWKLALVARKLWLMLIPKDGLLERFIRKSL